MPSAKTHRSSSFTTADLSMLFVAAIWGGSYAIVKDAYRDIAPLPFLLARFTLASAVLVPILWHYRRELPSTRTQWWGTILVGLVGIGAYQLFFSLGLQYTTASNSTLIIATSPLFTALLAPLAGLGRSTTLQKIALPLSLIGVYLLTGADGALHLKGDLLSLAGAFAVGLSFTLAEKMLGEGMGVASMALAIMIGTVSLVPVTLPTALAFDWSQVGTLAWLELAYAAILAGSLGYVLWYHNLVRLGALRGSVYAFLMPVVGVIVAVLLLDEPFRWQRASGGFLVLLGVALARGWFSRLKPTAPPVPAPSRRQ